MEQADGSTGRVKLTRARIAKGLSKVQLAKRVGVDRITIAHWEDGTNCPQEYYHQKLADALGKTVEELELKKSSAQQRSTPSAPQGEEKDRYNSLLLSHLPLHLWHIVCNWPSNDTHYSGLQLMITLELEDNIAMNPDDVMNRRETLYLLVGTPIAWCTLSAFMPVLKRPIEEILPQCAAGITACWYLRKGKDFVFVSESLDKYIPTLEAIAVQASESQRKAAADLLAQCFLRKSQLAKHVTNTSDAIRYAEQAEKYSKAAENPLLQVMAQKRRSAEHWYANQHGEARLWAEKANSLLGTIEKAPPILQSCIHSELVANLGFAQEKENVVALIDRAREEFSAQPKDGSVSLWMYHSETTLVLNDGWAYFHLGMYQEAFDAFGQIANLPSTTETGRVEGLINQAMAAAELREMEQCIALWTAGIEGAKALGSTAWVNEAILVYRTLRRRWSQESQIIQLRSHIEDR